MKSNLSNSKESVKCSHNARTECCNVKTCRATEASGKIPEASSTSIDDKDKDECPHFSMSYEHNQLVPYHADPEASGLDQLVAVPEFSAELEPSLTKYAPSTEYVKVLPSVGTYTAQCTLCLKWRLIPTQEKFEEIRAHSANVPFTCDTVNLWRNGVSCDDPEDISPDNERLWAIDKAGIPETPFGWKRELRIRGEGSTKFADVYYVTPRGKPLRSMVEIEKYLQEHPEYTEAGVNITQFSFQTPKPAREDYVRKRPSSLSTRKLGGKSRVPDIDEPTNVRPLAWEAPAHCSDLDASDRFHHSFAPPRKKRTLKARIKDKRFL